MTDDGGNSDTRDRLAERRGIARPVYEPAEDSALLATACIDEITSNEVVIEVGSGSGYVAAEIRDTVSATVIGVDVNPYACRRTSDRSIPAIRGDLLSPVADSVADVIVCNPPYLPTEPREERDDWVSIAVSGGPTGRVIVERLLADANRVLHKDGRLYLLLSSLMDIEAVRETARERGLIGMEIARDASFPYEVLTVFRFDRST